MVVARCQRGRAGIITWDALFLDVFFVSDVLIIAKKSKAKIPRQGPRMRLVHAAA